MLLRRNNPLLTIKKKFKKLLKLSRESQHRIYLYLIVPSGCTALSGAIT